MNMKCGVHKAAQEEHNMARRNHLTARLDEEMALASDSTTDALAAVPLVYDYDQIDAEHREEVRADAAYIKAGMHRTSKEMLEWGARLTRIKERTDHGQFGAILETELGFNSPRLPQMWMAAAERLGGKSENFSQLPASALYLLGASSTPEEAVEAIEERIDAGEQLTLNDVRSAVSELKRPAAHVLTLDETIKVIWGAIKYKQTLQERLREAKALNYAARYKPYLGNGQELDSDTFHTAWSTVVSELEGRIEHARKQHEQAQRYQQRTLEDAAADAPPAAAIDRRPAILPETLTKAVMRLYWQTNNRDWKNITDWFKSLTLDVCRELCPDHIVGGHAWATARQVGCQEALTAATPYWLREEGWVLAYDFHYDGWRPIYNGAAGYTVYPAIKDLDEVLPYMEEQHAKLTDKEVEMVSDEPATENDHRADRIAAIKVAFVQCLATFKEYSELTGDFTGPIVPKLGIEALQRKLASLETILEAEEK